MDYLFRKTKPMRTASARADTAMRNAIGRGVKRTARAAGASTARFVKRLRRTAPGRKRTIRHGSSGRFRKNNKRRIKRPNKAILNHSEVYGTVTGKNAVYHGFLTCGGKDFILKQYAESLLRAIILQQGVTLRDRHTPIPWSSLAGKMQKITLRFSRTAEDGSISLTDRDVSLGTALAYSNFDAIVALMLAEFKSYTYSDRQDFVGWFLYEFQGDSSTARAVKQDYSPSSAQFYCCVKTVFKVQNQTLNDSSTKSTDVVDSNPLEGKIYTFSSGPPRVRPQLHTAAQQLDNFQQDNEPNGLVLAPPKTEDIFNKGRELFSCPPGSQMFSNCTSTVKVQLEPGANKSISTTFTFKGTVNQFFKRVCGLQSRFTMGQTTLIGLEPSMRSSNEETVKIAYNLDKSATAYLSPRRVLVIPQSNTATLKDIV